MGGLWHSKDSAVTLDREFVFPRVKDELFFHGLLNLIIDYALFQPLCSLDSCQCIDLEDSAIRGSEFECLANFGFRLPR